MKKTAKVFISSTFRDLDQERSYLVNCVFRKLQHDHPDYQIYPVDLRWGITRQEAESGQVVDLCLKYLHESQPFFIGILGDRYGSVLSQQSDISDEVIGYYPQLPSDIASRRSVTEIEIMNGVLRQKSPVKAIFFVKKNPQRYAGESEELFAKQQKLHTLIRQQTVYPWIEFEDDLTVFDQAEKFISEALQLSDEPQKSNESVLDDLKEIVRENRERREAALQAIGDITPYRPILDAVSEMIERSTRLNLVSHVYGQGVTSMLAHFGADYRASDRHIYIHLYADYRHFVLLSEQMARLIFDVAREAIRAHWNEKRGVAKVINWFRIGLTDHDIDKNESQLMREMSRYKFRFILDNTHYTANCGLSPATFTAACIDHVMSSIAECIKQKIDYRITMMTTRGSVGADVQIPHYEIPISLCFDSAGYIRQFLGAHSKRLEQPVSEKLARANIARLPGCLKLILQYMVSEVRHEELASFVEQVAQYDNIYQVLRLYVANLADRIGREKARRLGALLLVHKGGLFLHDWEALSGLSPLAFKQALSILRPLLLDDTTIRIGNIYCQQALIQDLQLTDAEIKAAADESARYFNRMIHTQGTWEHFARCADRNFYLVSEYFFQACLPPGENIHITLNTPIGERGKSDYMQKLTLLQRNGGLCEKNIDKAFKQYCINMCINATQKAFHELKKEGKSWRDQEAFIAKQIQILQERAPIGPNSTTRLRAHVEALSALDSPEELEKVATNPIYINALWNDIGFLAAWEKLLARGVSICREELKSDKIHMRERRMYNICCILRRFEAAKYYNTKN